jgi:hypothetical protein
MHTMHTMHTVHPYVLGEDAGVEFTERENAIHRFNEGDGELCSKLREGVL